MKDLFGKEVIIPPGADAKGERIAVHQYKQLVSIYGKMEGKKCGACEFCVRHQAGSKKVYKCDKAKQSRSQATDWNSYWAACGLFKKSK